MHRITIDEVDNAAQMVAEKIKQSESSHVLYGVPRGGVPATFAVARYLPDSKIVNDPQLADVIIDDLIDSGATMSRYAELCPDTPFYALFDKRTPWLSDRWLVLPWEISETKDDSATDIVIRLLQYIGEDPNRDGLKETPQRVYLRVVG